MKKLLSLVLALVLCLGLSAAAFAVDVTGEQLSPDWGDGPSLTLKGVTAQKEVDMNRLANPDVEMCYDVAVGGSMVLKLDFPDGHDRVYTLVMGGIYVSPDWDDILVDEDGIGAADLEIPAERVAYRFEEKDGKTEYVYKFTDHEAGELKGYNKILCANISWIDDSDGDGVVDADGSAFFYVRVVPAEPVIPKVRVSSQPLTVDGEAVEIQAYNIGGGNFFKLRDVAMMLSGTDARFSVGYDADARAVTARRGEAYTAIGGELTSGEDKSASCVLSDQSISVDGEKLDVTVYNIGGSNYFMLRDLGSALGFSVEYDAETRTVLVSTKQIIPCIKKFRPRWGLNFLRVKKRRRQTSRRARRE